MLSMNKPLRLESITSSTFSQDETTPKLESLTIEELVGLTLRLIKESVENNYIGSLSIISAEEESENFCTCDPDCACKNS